MGPTVLYYGCRKKTEDFLYEEELTELQEAGLLELHVAFSRDQGHKVYVQHLLLETGARVWELIKDGAHVYVCGWEFCLLSLKILMNESVGVLKTPFVFTGTLKTWPETCTAQLKRFAKSTGTWVSKKRRLTSRAWSRSENTPLTFGAELTRSFCFVRLGLGFGYSDSLGFFGDMFLGKVKSDESSRGRMGIDSFLVLIRFFCIQIFDGMGAGTNLCDVQSWVNKF